MIGKVLNRSREYGNMKDEETTIKNLQDMIGEFCDEREWGQFHNPKDLAIGISTEAAELLEIFRFKDESQSTDALTDPAIRERISDELADVLYFTLRFSQMNGMDLSEALSKKMEKNKIKYPVETSRGCNKKYNEY